MLLLIEHFKETILRLFYHPATIRCALVARGVQPFLEVEDRDKEKIYSKRVRAGKRTYFFDVKATRANDYYLILTESHCQPRDGGFSFEKQKMFLYKEDFAKFIEALQETIDDVKQS